MKIEGCTALVTGATGGIGGALVAALLDAGADLVVAADIDERLLQPLRTLDRERVEIARCDVTSETAVAELADLYPGVDIVINSHGIVVHQSYLEAGSLDAFRREMEVNYWGQVIMSRAFLPTLANRRGALVNLLSPLAHVTFPFAAAYCASKAACRALTDAMRAEMADSGVQVMAVYPGSIDTPMMRNVNVPKSSPGEVAQAVIAGLRSGETEVWAGAGAEEMRDQLRTDPDALIAAASRHLRLSDINAAGSPVG